jgi:hypothetical protein
LHSSSSLQKISAEVAAMFARLNGLVNDPDASH